MGMAHFSLDDCVLWAELLTSPRASLFDHPMMADLRALHERYGAVFTLNLFVTDGCRRLREADDRYAAEYAANAAWLRLAFHAEDAETHYDYDCPEAIAASYREFTDAALRMTGTPQCIDRMVRLGFFSGTQANVQAIRGISYGISGLLTADDTRRSYYLDEMTNQRVQCDGKANDPATGLPLLRSEKRLESLADLTQVQEAIAGGQPTLEFFTHEQNWTAEVRARAETICQMLTNAQYTFGFPCDTIAM